MKTYAIRLLLLMATTLPPSLIAQEKIPEVRLDFNEDGSHYVRFTGMNQVWIRNTQLNPGSLVYNDPVQNISDIGIRRLRFQVYGQLTDRVFFYTQFGQNNFSFLQPRHTGAFFHDAVTEFRVHETRLSLGGGLSGWGGFLRYSSPGVGSLLSLDAPLYQQATNGQNDQFLRKLSVYAKGRFGRFDYRLAATKPLSVQNAGVAGISSDANYSTEPPKFQYQGYFKIHLMEMESNLTPYNTGTYLGKKKVLTLGGGFVQQNKAMWNTNALGDTVRTAMQLVGVDVFYESPLSAEKDMALTLYGAYSYTNFGHNYLRNVGAMNPANGVTNGTINGAGNGYPMLGTGSTYYAQAGFAFGKNLMTEGGKLQPYAAAQYSVYQGLDEAVLMAEGGINWFVHGTHGAKITLNYQSRPVFDTDAGGKKVEVSRLGMTQLQFQVSF